MPGMPPRKIGHIFQCLSVSSASCPLSLLEKTSHLVCLPGKQASSFQKKASALDQPTGSVLLLTTIVSLKEFSFLIIAFRLSKHLLTAYTGSVALVTLLLKVPRNSGQQTWHHGTIINKPQRVLSCLSQLLGSGLTCSARSSQMYCRTSLHLRNLCKFMDESQKLSLKKHFKCSNGSGIHNSHPLLDLLLTRHDKIT